LICYSGTPSHIATDEILKRVINNIFDKKGDTLKLNSIRLGNKNEIKNI
jgi:hypothetical protein